MKILLAAFFATILTSVRAIAHFEIQRPAVRSYSLASEICCDGTIFENKNSSDYECCGHKLIERKNEICCFPEAYPKSPNTECCGNKTFNTQTHFCHDWITVQRWKTGHKSWQKHVILPTGTDVDSTCGNKVIDLNIDICCNYEAVPDPDHKLTCCGGQGDAYDPDTEVCCRNLTYTSVIPKAKPSDQWCCNGKPYSYVTSICTNGEVVDVPSTGDIQFCSGHRKVYNVSSEICCPFSDAVVKKLQPDHNECCGKIPYNRDESICCGSPNETKVYTRVEAENKKCCGIQLASENEECCSSRFPYDPKTQTCCELWKDDYYRKIGVIHVGSGRECCGLEIMDNEKEECCETTIVPKTPDGHSHCCLHTTSDIDIEEYVTTANKRYYSGVEGLHTYK